MLIGKPVTHDNNILKTLKSHPWTFYLLSLLLLGGVQFHFALHFTWLYDDYDFLAHIAAIESGDAHLFSTNYDGGGRLTTVLFLYVMQMLFGDSQVPYHAVYLVCYILACWTLAWTLFQVGYDRTVSMIAGVLFLFTVTHYAVPFWLSCFAYVTCLIFGCLAIVAYGRYTSSSSPKDLALACVAILLATLSHAGAVGFAGVAGYLAIRRGASVRDVAKSVWLLIGIAAGLSYLFLQAYPGHAQNVNVARISQVSHVANFVVAYLGRAYLSPFWTTTTFVAGPNGFDKLVGIGLIAAGVLTFVYRRGTFTDAIAMSTLLLPAFGGSTLDEYRPRYFYYADIGPALLVAWAIAKATTWVSKGRGAWIKPACIGCGLALVLVVSHVHFGKATHTHWAVVGRDLISRGKPEEGIRRLRSSIDAVPELLPPFCYTRYALVAYQVGADPLRILETGRRIYPDHAEIAYLHRIAVCIEEGSEIPDDLIREVQAAGDDAIASVAVILNNVGVVQYREENYATAERFYRAAITTYPGYFNAYLNYANTLYVQDRAAETIDAYRSALEVDPARAPETLQGLRKLAEQTPANARATELLVSVLIYVGNLKEAIDRIEEGIAGGLAKEGLLSEYGKILSILKDDGQHEAATMVEQRIHQLSGKE